MEKESQKSSQDLSIMNRELVDGFISEGLLACWENRARDVYDKGRVNELGITREDFVNYYVVISLAEQREREIFWYNRR